MQTIVGTAGPPSIGSGVDWRCAPATGRNPAFRAGPAAYTGRMPSLQMLRRSWRSWLHYDGHMVGPAWLQWLWTLLFCAALAGGLTLLGFAANARRVSNWTDPGLWWRWYQLNLIVTLAIGVLIHLGYAGITALLGPPRVAALRGWRRVLYYAGVPLACTAVGWPLGVRLAGLGTGSWFPINEPRVLLSAVGFALVITCVLYQFFEAKSRQIAAEKHATEARLKLLQGQIEPHFLFNTLAGVIGRSDADPSAARRMLEHLVDYLRGSLGGLRSERHTLGDELALVDAFLAIAALRMGGRLAVQVQADAKARATPLPPLLLQPLVENALRHGLEPKVEGGTITVSARRDAQALHLAVHDDGLGLAGARADTRGAGTAIGNIRVRLAEAFGDDAELVIADADGGGTLATLRLPC